MNRVSHGGVDLNGHFLVFLISKNHVFFATAVSLRHGLGSKVIKVSYNMRKHVFVNDVLLT